MSEPRTLGVMLDQYGFHISPCAHSSGDEQEFILFDRTGTNCGVGTAEAQCAQMLTIDKARATRVRE